MAEVRGRVGVAGELADGGGGGLEGTLNRFQKSVPRNAPTHSLRPLPSLRGRFVPSAGASADSTSDLSTDCRLAYNDTIDYQANIFGAFDSTPYFIFYRGLRHSC